MKKIKTISELEVGEWYITRSKTRYEKCNELPKPMPMKCDEISGRKYIGSNIWALEDNNQALEKYDVYGPFDLVSFIDVIDSFEETAFILKEAQNG